MAVVLIGILSSLSVLGFRSTTAKMRLTSETTSFYNKLKIYRDLSKTEKRSYGVRISVSASTMTFFLDNDNSGTKNSGDTDVETVTFHKQFKIVKAFLPETNTTITSSWVDIGFRSTGASSIDAQFLLGAVGHPTLTKAVILKKANGILEMPVKVPSSLGG